jgi:hypothetical protein
MKNLRILLLLLTAVLMLTVAPNILVAVSASQIEPVNPLDQPIDPLLDDPSIPPMEGGEPYPYPIIYYEPPVADEIDAPDAPAINVWYGTTQNFGQIGNPQRWLNILGNVTGATSLSYSINGGAFKPATIGSGNTGNPPRLGNPGDFNIELPIADLNNGANTLIIRASDGASNVTQNVTVNYNPNSVWPLPTTVVWSNYGNLLQAAQPVDGLWTINGGQLETVQPGYDRLVAIGQGNMSGNGWTDYEVKVPVTVHSLNGPGGTQPPSQSSGVGLIVRWSGHTPTSNDPAGGPTLGWRQIGALAWYRWASPTKAAFEIRGFGGQDITPPQSDKAIQFGVPYIFKLSVQSAAFDGNTATYRFKFWPVGEPEPPQWYMTATGASGEPAAGSVVLVAHHAMVSFGNVEVKPVASNQGYNINVQQPANGSIFVSPPADGVAYRYGETVQIRSQGQGNYVMTNWTGDFSGNENPLIFDITGNLTVGAVFEAGSKPKLNVSANGQGTVEVVPKKSNNLYSYGELVTLTPKPNLGYIFSGWTGDLSGASNPAVIVMDETKNITANFIMSNPSSPVSDDFNACALNTNLWTFVNPVGDGSYEMNGTQLRLDVPGGVSHNIWDNGNRSVRVMQPTQNVNFEIVAKFESAVTKRYQMQGILVEEDGQNFLRLEVHFDGSSNRLYVARMVDGKPKAIINGVYLPSTPSHLRVTRVGTLWSFSSSDDGDTWFSAGSFEHAMVVTKSGVFAANHGGTTGQTSPAHTAIVDYFFNTAAPIQPEDGTDLNNLKVTVNKVGQGTVNLSPAKPGYACGENVTLTAVPANGWVFSGWSGDISGTNSSAQLTVSRNHTVTATFMPSTGAKVYMPMVIDN